MLKHFIIFLALTSLSFSQNINNSKFKISLENYRVNGIATLEKDMDKELSTQEYWNRYLQDKDTKFGYIEEYSSVLACNKEKSTLTLYIQNSDDKYEFIKEHNAYTGENKGDKIQEGDKKTPIGIYQIVDKLSKDTNLDPFYGPLAFVTSYPNTYDTFRGKNGSGIWIHGLPTKQTRDEFTRGCIAIQNSNIECLNRNINIKNTLLIIDKDEVQQDISKETLANILSSLYQWRYAWLYNDVETYLSFYANDFVRFDGMKYDRFKNYKTRIFKKTEKKTIIFNDINVLPYPNTENIYQITFKEYYKSDSFQFTGDKTLMVRLTSDNKLKIFTEK